jgi:glycosyltransferase involved in cell wall biosynthesis
MCDEVGGTETMVASLLEQMDGGAVESELATLAGPGPIAARVASRGIPVRSLGDGGSLPLAAGRLARVLRHGRFDVVNAYGLKATMLARAGRAVSPRTRFVCGVRGLHISGVEDVAGAKARTLLALERLGSPLVDVYDANSTGALELLASAGIPRRKLRYIPNGLDIADWPAVRRTPSEPPVVVCVARFVPLKRQQDLVRAAEVLVAREIPFRLVLVGAGPTLDATRAQAQAGPAADQIEFTGALPPAAVRARLAAADVFCLCSAWEGMPGSVMEAMASGLPVLGTRVNGIADLVVPGETGTLVPAGDPAALAEALAALLLDRGARERLGAAGRERIVRDFTLEAMAAAKTALYVKLAEAA